MAVATKLERDPVELDPKHYTVEAGNDDIRIVRIRYGPNEGSVMHQHRPGVGVFLTDANVTFTWPDGKVEQVTAKRGEVMKFDEAWEHNSSNAGDAFEVVYVELKR